MKISDSFSCWYHSLNNFSDQYHACYQKKQKIKPRCHYGRQATAYTVPIAILTFKFRQGR